MHQLEPLPGHAVEAICQKIAAAEPSFVVKLELGAFAETKTRHDAKRLINAQR